MCGSVLACVGTRGQRLRLVLSDILSMNLKLAVWTRLTGRRVPEIFLYPRLPTPAISMLELQTATLSHFSACAGDLMLVQKALHPLNHFPSPLLSRSSSVSLPWLSVHLMVST